MIKHDHPVAISVANRKIRARMPKFAEVRLNAESLMQQGIWDFRERWKYSNIRLAVWGDRSVTPGLSLLPSLVEVARRSHHGMRAGCHGDNGSVELGEVSFAKWRRGLHGSSSDATRRMDALIRALTDEPLLPASLGAKELFHSNLLAWMCQRFPEQARQVFRPWLVPAEVSGPDRVRREFRHLDLVIELSGFQPLVIENKLTALPDEEQLSRYASGALAGFRAPPTLLLLSLANPGWRAGRKRLGGQDWSYLSYADLAQRLARVFWRSGGFEGQVLTHEAAFVHLLHRVVEEAGVQDGRETFQLPPATVSQLVDVGLSDAIGKIRGSQVMRRIEAGYARDGVRPTWTEVSLSHGQPVLSAYWQRANGDSIGWQQQGRQWRLAMILTSLHGRSARHVKARERHAAKHVTWFDFTPLCRVLRVGDHEIAAHRSAGALGWQRFNPDFVYRYRLLPAATTVHQFVRVARTYGQAAQAWDWS